MRILKGTLLGLWVFGYGTMVWLYLAVYRDLPHNSAVDTRVIIKYTTQSLLWWAALVLCLVLGYAITRSWSGPRVLWVALLVTGLVPAVFLVLFVVLLVHLIRSAGLA